DLLLEGAAASAALLGPAHAGPAGGGHVPLPGQPHLERLVLAAGAAEPARVRELARQVGLEPVADLCAERAVRRGVVLHHAPNSTKHLLERISPPEPVPPPAPPPPPGDRTTVAG